MEAVFTNIFKRRYWRSEESVSGTGSEMQSTVNIRTHIPIVFDKYKIRRVLDVGCGDFNWMRTLVGGFDYYLGIDIVKPLIEENKKFETDTVEFKYCNIEELDLKSYNFDVVILSDVLVHLSFKDIDAVLSKLRESGIKYILTTHFTRCKKNRNIFTGEWRPLRWNISPFNFPNPLEKIAHNDEKSVNAADKTLSLWEI